jgi:hypothetical protein
LCFVELGFECFVLVVGLLIERSLFVALLVEGFEAEGEGGSVGGGGG